MPDSHAQQGVNVEASLCPVAGVPLSLYVPTAAEETVSLLGPLFC